MDCILTDFTVQSWDVRSASSFRLRWTIGRRTQIDGQGSDCDGGHFNFRLNTIRIAGAAPGSRGKEAHHARLLCDKFKIGQKKK
jgi:hypothetical protein